MPRQFTPQDRETVREAYESNASVHEVSKCGAGLTMAYKNHASGEDANERRMFTELMESAGWYLAQYEVDSAGDIAIIMPVTEVPE